jgi:hypothetical protein
MKTTQDAISKCNKKAWEEIKKIQHAPNMVCVDSLIGDALAKTFGVWNEGVMIIQMRKLGQMGEVESRVRIHRANWDKHMSQVRHYLIEMIPARLYKTMMYQKMVGHIA